MIVEWKHPRFAVCAVADATEAWMNLFSIRIGQRGLDESTRLIMLLRQARGRAKKRLISENERQMQTSMHHFRDRLRHTKLDLWVPPAHAARIGLAYAQTAAVQARDLQTFEEAIGRIGMLDSKALLFPWRMCDAFNPPQLDAVPIEARNAFEAIWLAGEPQHAYDYAKSWNAVNVHVEAGAVAHAI